MLYEAVHRVRVWLWERREKALARDARPTGASDGDWIGANVAASAASSGAGAGSQPSAPTCDGGASYSDGGSCGSAGGC